MTTWIGYSETRISAGGGNTKNVTYDVGSGADRVLLVMVYIAGLNSPETITSVSYGPSGSETAMTEGLGYTNTDYSYDETQAFYLLNPASGSNNIKIVVSTDAEAVQVFATHWTGVTAVTGEVIDYENSVGTDGQPTVNVTTVSGRTVAALIGYDIGTVNGTASGSATMRANVQGTAGGGALNWAVLDVTASGSPQSIGMAGLPGGNYWSAWGFSLTPVGGSSAGAARNLALLGIG